MKKIAHFEVTMEQSKCYELELKERKLALQQEMDHLNECKLALQQEMDLLEDVHESSSHTQLQSDEPWNLDSTGVQFQCVQCTHERRTWYANCHQQIELTCGACKQCAFCTPKWRECWEGNHLPKKIWRTRLNTLVHSADMQATFKNEGVTKRTPLKTLKTMYLTRSFQSAPVSVKDAADSSNSLPERVDNTVVLTIVSLKYTVPVAYSA